MLKEHKPVCSYNAANSEASAIIGRKVKKIWKD